MKDMFVDAYQGGGETPVRAGLAFAHLMSQKIQGKSSTQTTLSNTAGTSHMSPL